MNTRAYLSVLIDGIKYIKKSLRVVSNGPSSNYAIIQQAHKLEKGLAIREPRRLWGYDNARLLIDYIAEEQNKIYQDVTAINIGKAVLSAYISYKDKIHDPEEKNRTDQLKNYIVDHMDKGAIITSQYGGTLRLKREDVWVNEGEVASLFRTRHSVRDFDNTPVDLERLERAIDYALRAPSACNRQPIQVYVISGQDREQIGGDNSYHADKYLILTGVMKAFSIPELNDWIVSTAVFAGYLTLALHAVGIGSCIFRKEIVRGSKYNESLKRICKIPCDEQIVLEIAIGNYRDEFNVPVSYRRSANDIIHYI